jgi:hypothetical protein
MAINPNWPVVEHAWAPYWSANGGDIPLDRYAEVSSRTTGATSTGRGRQYETDQVQAGTASTVLRNSDGALDPMNGAGPWAGRIMPYQPYRIRAQYPPTANLLTQVAATGGEGYVPGVIPQGPAGIGVFSATDNTGGSIVASGSAFQGSNVFQFAVPASAPITPTVNGMILYSMQTAVAAGQSYAMQLEARNVTASTSVQVAPFIAWYTSAGATPATWVNGSNYTLAGATNAAWTYQSVTATAPSNAYAMCYGLILTASPSAACSVQVDAWQLEKGTTPSTFTIPGIWYPLYGGYVERWPSSWGADGLGVVSPTAVDAFALLSQRLLRDPLTEELYRRTPRFIYTLGDPQGVSSFADDTGNNPAAPVAVSKYGAGTLTSGTSIAANSPTGTYTGSSGTVVAISNSYPGTNLVPAPATYISLSGAGVKGPTNPALWTRVIAFRYTGPAPTTGNFATLWHAMGPYGNSSYIQAVIQPNGIPAVLMSGPNGAAANLYAAIGGTNCVDGNWHLLIFQYSAAAAQIIVSQDGATGSVYGSVPSGITPTGIVSDCLGAFVDVSVGNGTTYNFEGDISYAAEFPFYFGNTDTTSIYSAWRNAFSGDSTDQRYNRILGWAGYTGVSDVWPGQTRSMGPAATDGQDALSALADVVETENGVHYVSTNGTISFRGRGVRYNSTTPVYTFGENTGAGEWPYEEATLDFDPTHLANIVQVTQTSSGQVFTGQDLTSQGNYFPRTMTRTVNSTSTLECQDAANYLVSRYRNPLTRVDEIKLHPSAFPALWPVCLSLELNMRVRVMRRPFGAPAIQVDCFIENIKWDLDDQGDAFVTLQCSPVDPTPYGLFASFHTTLNATATSGTASLTINAGADNTNVLAAQIGVGQQLLLEPGTANAETVTVQAVGATSTGWATGVVTLTGALAYTHAPGAVVCEPLPAGVTNPATYDTSAKFDSAAFSY